MTSWWQGEDSTRRCSGCRRSGSSRSRPRSTGRVRERLRGFRVLMSFSFGAAPWEAGLFLFSGALMSLVAPVTALGAKLLVDAVLQHRLNGGLVAAAVLSVAGALSLIVTLYYVDLLFSVAEKAGAAVDRRL